MKTKEDELSAAWLHKDGDKREEGAVLFKAASSSIPRGGILPLEC